MPPRCRDPRVTRPLRIYAGRNRPAIDKRQRRLPRQSSLNSRGHVFERIQPNDDRCATAAPALLRARSSTPAACSGSPPGRAHRAAQPSRAQPRQQPLQIQNPVEARRISSRLSKSPCASATASYRASRTAHPPAAAELSRATAACPSVSGMHRACGTASPGCPDPANRGSTNSRLRTVTWSSSSAVECSSNLGCRCAVHRSSASSARSAAPLPQQSPPTDAGPAQSPQATAHSIAARPAARQNPASTPSPPRASAPESAQAAPAVPRSRPAAPRLAPPSGSRPQPAGALSAPANSAVRNSPVETSSSATAQTRLPLLVPASNSAAR